MPNTKRTSNNFARALRETRKSLGFTQEDFAMVSSRTYVSTLERGLKSPTLAKVDELAQVMDVQPLTLLAMAYLPQNGEKPLAALLEGLKSELSAVLRLQEGR